MRVDLRRTPRARRSRSGCRRRKRSSAPCLRARRSRACRRPHRSPRAQHRWLRRPALLTRNPTSTFRLGPLPIPLRAAASLSPLSSAFRASPILAARMLPAPWTPAAEERITRRPCPWPPIVGPRRVGRRCSSTARRRRVLRHRAARDHRRRRSSFQAPAARSETRSRGHRPSIWGSCKCPPAPIEKKKTRPRSSVAR